MSPSDDDNLPGFDTCNYGENPIRWSAEKT